MLRHDERPKNFKVHIKVKGIRSRFEFLIQVWRAVIALGVFNDWDLFRAKVGFGVNVQDIGRVGASVLL
jgi:hypothetical protein